MDQIEKVEAERSLDRILQSRGFQASGRISRFLRFVAEHALRNDPAPLKEYLVGTQVFDRPETFDSRTDTIVRVEARRLRSKLKEYYENEGQNDPVVLELPQKGYAVTFRVKHQPAQNEPAAIVVLPFTNMSGNPANEYIADGLTEEIIGALAALPELRVVARTSSFAFKGRGEDIRRIGAELHVKIALEGSIRIEATRIRVAAQLINVADGFHLWSEIYDRELTGVIELEQEITGAIAEALKPWTSPGLTRKREAQSDVSPEAHDCYLKGRYFYHKLTIADIRKSVSYLQSAIENSPRFSLAYSALADAYMAWCTLQSEPPWEITEKARTAALRALELDKNSAEAHCAMGTVLGIGDWDWRGAERELRLAIDLKPSLVLARISYALSCLFPLGRPLDAVAELRVALTFDPVSTFLRTLFAQALVFTGEPDASMDELARVFDLDPHYQVAQLVLALAFEAKGRYQEAIDTLLPLRAELEDHPNYSGYLGYAYAMLGNRGEAKRIVEDLEKRFLGDWIPGCDIALIYTGLNDKKSALRWLERAGRQRSFDAMLLRVDPRFDVLHGDRDFEALMKQLGI